MKQRIADYKMWDKKNLHLTEGVASSCLPISLPQTVLFVYRIGKRIRVPTAFFIKYFTIIRNYITCHTSEIFTHFKNFSVVLFVIVAEFKISETKSLIKHPFEDS